MKVIPKTISNFVVTPGEKSVILAINESLEVEYLLTENSDNEILQDLVEAKAFATALLYLNETYRLVTNTKLFKENKVEDYYNDCNKLLKENTEIVEEKGIPLVSINGYNIYESDLGILRGNGEKKLKESFFTESLEELDTGLEVEVQEAIKQFIIDSFTDDTYKHYGFGLREPYTSDGWMFSIYKDTTGNMPSYETLSKMRKYYERSTTKYTSKYGTISQCRTNVVLVCVF